MIDLSFSDTNNRAGTRKVFLNKQLLRGATAVIHEESTIGDRPIPRFIGVTFRGRSINAIRPFTISDLFAHIQHFNVATSISQESDQSDTGGFGPLMVGSNLSKKPLECPIYIPVRFDSDRWNKPYSIADLAFHIHQALNVTKGRYWFQAQSEASLTEGFGLYVSFPIESQIEDVLANVIPDLKDVITYALGILEAEDVNTIATKFNFPTDVRPACEQYLLYFGQFLRDLGIEANTQLTEQASNVLFTVTPLNREQALDSIREALSCYLQMPSSPEAMSALESSQDIAAMQLQSNIFHLKSQLHLASAVMQAKEAVITAQQAEIAFLKQSFDLRRYLPSSPDEDSDDKEPLIEGVVSVKKFDYKGFEFDLPAIARKLKRYISGE